MLAPGDVLVRFARPEALEDPGVRAAAEALLTAEERARVARFHFERDRRLHLAARALLRRTLSSCAGVEPGDWRFAATAAGQPFVEAPATALRFSVAHTRGLAAVAVALDAELGVDAEEIPDEAPREVVEGSLAPLEREALDRMLMPDRAAAFAAIWTMKEAYAKARGLGLALPFESFGVALDPPRLAQGDEASTWTFVALRPTARHRAAVCARCSMGALPPRYRVEGPI